MRKLLTVEEHNFCKYYAAGGYTLIECVETAFSKWVRKKIQKDNNMPNLRAKGNRLIARKEVKKYIDYLRKEYDAQAAVSETWVRKELVEIVKFGSDTAKRGALDQLSKLGGYYELDNTQKQSPVTVRMEF